MFKIHSWTGESLEVNEEELSKLIEKGVAYEYDGQYKTDVNLEDPLNLTYIESIIGPE
jgi:hypothetical protein